MMASYNERSPLFGSDREITASADYRRFGGPNLGSPFYGVPATILSVSGNLPGLNSSFAAVPIGSTGVGLQPADFAATAGVQNLGSFTSYQSLVPSSTRTGLFLNAEYRLRGGTELFAELLASEYEANVTTAPAALLQASVPATNPFNPFGTAVRASGVVRGAEQLGRLLLRDELVRPLVGARGELGAWEWETTALSSRDHGLQASTGQANAALLSAALASADPRTALNPFVDGPMASPDVLAPIFGAVTETPSKANATVINGFVRRPLRGLPAGMLDLVLGSEYEQSELERGMDAERSVRAVFAELRAPLLAGGDARREILALEGAVRYDDYSDFGDREHVAARRRVSSARGRLAARDARHGVQAADALQPWGAAIERGVARHRSAPQQGNRRDPIHLGRQCRAGSYDLGIERARSRVVSGPSREPRPVVHGLDAAYRSSDQPSERPVHHRQRGSLPRPGRARSVERRHRPDRLGRPNLHQLRLDRSARLRRRASRGAFRRPRASSPPRSPART